MPNYNMEHPLISGVTEKTTEELIDIVASLNKKLSYASRTSNFGMSNQIMMALNSYRSELQKRQQEEWNAHNDDDDLDEDEDLDDELEDDDKKEDYDDLLEE